MPALILLHGALGCQEAFRSLEAYLKPHFDVYTLNFSGHGREVFNPTGFGIVTFAEELEAFIDRHDLKQVNIFGYSMGGYIALYLASVEPHLIHRIITLGTKFEWNPEGAAREASRLDPDVMEHKIPAYTQGLSENHGTQWKKLVRSTAAMMLQLGGNPLLHQQRLRSVLAKVTILKGDRDRMVSDSECLETVELLPKGSFEILADTPHPLEKVKPEVLGEALLKHLNRL